MEDKCESVYVAPLRGTAAGIRVEGVFGRVPEEMPDVIRGWGAEEGAEVSSGVSKGGFEPRPRDTLGGVKIDFPVPDSRISFEYIYVFRWDENSPLIEGLVAALV